MHKRKVLFLCTGNSCRSQMAQAIVNQQLGQSWEAYSAGTQPAGFVHPLATQVLAEIGIEHQGQSKSVDAVREIDFDLVVTVCDSAAENCPIWLRGGRIEHLPFIDPARAVGSPEQVLTVFRDVRDQISEKIIALLNLYARS